MDSEFDFTEVQFEHLIMSKLNTPTQPQFALKGYYTPNQKSTWFFCPLSHIYQHLFEKKIVQEIQK